MSVGCVVLYWVGQNWRNIKGRDLIRGKDLSELVWNHTCPMNTEQKSGELGPYHQPFQMTQVKRVIFIAINFSLWPKILEHGTSVFNTNFHSVFHHLVPKKKFTKI